MAVTRHPFPREPRVPRRVRRRRRRLALGTAVGVVAVAAFVGSAWQQRQERARWQAAVRSQVWGVQSVDVDGDGIADAVLDYGPIVEARPWNEGEPYWSLTLEPEGSRLGALVAHEPYVALSLDDEVVVLNARDGSERQRVALTDPDYPVQLWFDGELLDVQHSIHHRTDRRIRVNLTTGQAIAAPLRAPRGVPVDVGVLDGAPVNLDMTGLRLIRRFVPPVVDPYVTPPGPRVPLVLENFMEDWYRIAVLDAESRDIVWESRNFGIADRRPSRPSALKIGHHVVVCLPELDVPASMDPVLLWFDARTGRATAHRVILPPWVDFDELTEGNVGPDQLLGWFDSTAWSLRPDGTVQTIGPHPVRVEEVTAEVERVLGPLP